ncbi:pentapeptide repeat-containing protein [Mucilaginibacter sp. BT774]|uniref:pentapeptide repeat-containing protein n=1 Tax=Mucilaginibacter sp. BT774 TaxID=3062276 RepID=UPI00267461F4|nr:pentapeptide repeat-containing protein [Mucilaginibacter sp. BT774]MDO3626061.1 pentapeptide repeat-containing protein [Mucilaginibacter sp. BT774]
METKMIGNKIAEARKKINISQAQLAQRVFVSPQAVGKWERGESIPDIITFNRLAEILGVDLNYFSENFQSANDTMTFKAVENNGDMRQTIQQVANLSTSPERQVLTNFSGSNLAESDFAGVAAHKRKFKGSALRGSDFAGADLTGSSFVASDAREANFDGTNLTDCTFSATDLTDASFNGTILVRTEFSKLGLTGAKFTDATLTDVKLTMTDLRKTIFENCVFEGVDFKYSDMRALCLDGQTFIGVKFDKAALNEATFKGATLKNVSFRPTYALTNKYYRAIKTICFDGAMMDKLTYAELKGLGAELSKVTFI